MALGWMVGIDVGGTFTDAIAKHRDGRTRIAKVASTPKDPSIALVDAFEELLKEGVDAPDVGLVFHGTTVATNAMLTGRISRVVLLATEGFRDVMAFRNGTKPLLYDLRQPRPNELVERGDRIEVRERVSGLGEVVEPLTIAEIGRVVDEVAVRGPDAIAIAFLFSYLRDGHERALADALRNAMPGVPVTASSDIAREFREYPRTATAVVNAALRPLVGRFVADAADGLRAIGVEAPFLVMQSNGGCVPAERAEREAHRLLLSGPTAGVAGTIALAARHGVDGVLSFDMGGTSLDVCLVEDGVPPTTSTQTVQDHPILVPSVDIVTAGAGGGSIAEVDRAGRLRVGPQSAGADPGPAAYGRGGTDATLTDAHVVAGILGPTPLAGRLPLDVDEAERAVSRVARRLGLEPMRAAEGIIAVATAHGVRALRRVSVERGLDPRRYALVAFGGAGPLLAGRVLDELGVATVLIPPHPGLFSAEGLMVTSLRIDDARSSAGSTRASCRTCSRGTARHAPGWSHRSATTASLARGSVWWRAPTAGSKARATSSSCRWRRSRAPASAGSAAPSASGTPRCTGMPTRAKRSRSSRLACPHSATSSGTNPNGSPEARARLRRTHASGTDARWCTASSGRSLYRYTGASPCGRGTCSRAPPSSSRWTRRS